MYISKRQFHLIPFSKLRVCVWRCISTSNLISVAIWYSNWLLSNLVYTSFRSCKNKAENKISFSLI